MRVIVLTWLGRLVLRSLSATWRWQIPNDMLSSAIFTENKGCIFVFWHGRQLMMPGVFEASGWRKRGLRLSTLISRHRDGRIIAGIIKAFGLDSIAGSSSRGAVQGGRKILEALQRGESVALTPDGPRGPAQRLKHGTVRIAQLSGRPIIALAASAKFSFRFGSWDRMMMPLPFARINVAHSGPLLVPASISDSQLRDFTDKLELIMNEVTEQVDRD